MKKLITLLILGSLLLHPVHSVRAEGISSDAMNVLVEQSQLLVQIKQKLAQLQYRATLFEVNLENAQKNLDEDQETIQNLTTVIANLDEQITATERQILNVKSQQESKKMEVSDVQTQIQELEAQLADEKEIVRSLMTLLYIKQQTYYSNGVVNPIKILASPNSVSQTLQGLTYLDLIEQQNQTHLEKIKTLSAELAERWGELQNKRDQLKNSDAQLAEKLTQLQTEREHQEHVLDETRAEAAVIEAILENSDERKEDLESEIRIYQNNVQNLEAKLAESDTLLSDDQKATLAQIQADMEQSFSTEEASQFLSLDWPVSPAKGLSAFFHDSGYQGTFGVDHYALDIRANQNTDIQAPADGVVTNVVFDPESTRFAYITIAHRMGVTTLYGHVSQPFVLIGDFVFKGQVIGKTGGNPGTPGSGARTTGPHLHFEVWQDGIRADPLKYLPLEQLSMDGIPEEYLDQIQAALAEQIKDLQGEIDE